MQIVQKIVQFNYIIQSCYYSVPSQSISLHGDSESLIIFIMLASQFIINSRMTMLLGTVLQCSKNFMLNLKVGARYIGRSIRFREQRSRRNQPPPSDDRGFVSWSCVALAGHGGVTGTLLGST